MVNNNLSKMRLKTDKKLEETKVKGGRAVARKQMQQALAEVKRIEKAEKLQQRIVAKQQQTLAKAEQSGDANAIAKARAGAEEALAVLQKIQTSKRAAEADLRRAIAAQKGEVVEPRATDLEGTAALSSASKDVESALPSEPARGYDSETWLTELQKSADYVELYPVNAPFAYVVIQATSPPKYAVHEVPLTEGEQELLKEIKTYLYETLDISFSGLVKPEEFLREQVKEVVSKFNLEGALSPASIDKILYYITRDFVGYGRLDPLIKDKMAEDISADGPDIPLYVYHRNYSSIETDVIFTKDELNALIYRLSQRSGRHISMARPLLDASLPNHDRLQLSIGAEVTTRGSTFTIRKFREVPFSPINLVVHGTFSLEMMAYLWMAVEHGANILIAGGTASGKTTVLNAVAMFIPPESKIVSIEDTREINLLHQNWIPAVTRQVEEGGHAIEMYDLLRTALRQRPEYVLVGEVRGVEAHTLFQAMATGHITMSTMHAESADTVVKRLTKHPIDVPLMLLDSLDIIAIQRQVKVGDRSVRRCTKILEVTGIDFEEETLKTNELFVWRPDTFEFTGESKLFVKIMEKLNITEDELIAEFARRRRILDAMQQQGMDDFQSLNRVLLDYSIDPEATEKRIVVEEYEER
jgi:flagellar protein FlaI